MAFTSVFALRALLINARYISRLFCSSFFILEFVAIFLDPMDVSAPVSFFVLGLPTGRLPARLELLRRKTAEAADVFEEDASDWVFNEPGGFCCIFDGLEMATGRRRFVEDFEDSRR